MSSKEWTSIKCSQCNNEVAVRKDSGTTKVLCYECGIFRTREEVEKGEIYGNTI